MEGNKDKDNTDNAPLRPVSSLLSHFENLSHTRSSSAVTPNTRDSSLLKSPEPRDDDPRSHFTRASVDLSRPRSPWTPQPQHADAQQSDQLYRHRTGGFANGEASHANGSPGRRHGRPMSLSFRSSPQLGPTLTVDSPRSPPRGFVESPEELAEDGHRVSRSPLGLDVDTGAGASHESLPPRPSRSSVAHRPGSPNSTVPGSLSPGELHSARFAMRDSPSDRKAKSASLPPPANRADKPKIPAKPVNLAFQESNMLAAPRAKRASSDLRVSPFSTPPSSPEKSPPKAIPPRPDRLETESPAQRLFNEERTASQDARELGFTRRPPPLQREPSRDTKPLTVQIPTGQQRQAEPLSSVPQSAQRLQATSDMPYDRPGLPPRASVQSRRVSPSRQLPADFPVTSPHQPSPQPRRPSPGRQPVQSRSPSRQMSNAEYPSPAHQQPPQPLLPRRANPSPSRQPPNADFPISPRPLEPIPQQQPLAPQQPARPSELDLHRQPSYSRENKPSYDRGQPPPPPQNPPQPRPRPDTEDEEYQYPSQPTVTLTDYPDASNANRRPPVIKNGPKEIPTRYDTRLMDVCGKYVCTTGYLTRVWDLTNGEQIMSLSHGETVKTLSMAFKPGAGLEDEGRRLWLGTNTGELHEVDIATRAVVASRSYPSRREVIKILRHKKEMWTMDDEGRLLIWPADETGVPNLQYSYHNPYDRVARGQTFSMVVGDELWLATGKDVHVYQPYARDDASFKVLRKPLVSQNAGEVTSGAYTTKNGRRVYLGHADGKISVYSVKDYACLAVVNASLYKINCLSVVGDYLWAGYKTGMIYVYDVNSNPWTVKKDWKAHDSPVSNFILDTSSVWTMNRLQVTSLGTDNCIRLWDGTLESDWLESRMQSRDVEFCTFREMRAVIMTWNAGASTPGSVRTSTFIQDAIHPEDPPGILVFGFQELVDLEDKKITAKSLLKSSKKKEKKEAGEKEHMSRQYRVWAEHLTRCINDCMPLDESYVLLHTANMVGLFTCVFVRHKERERIKNVRAAEVKRGMGGLHGNKGALILRFVLDDSSLCFVNCHLAAGQTQTAHRNNDIAAILEAECLASESSLTARADHFVSGGDGSMVMDHEICILNGDLNYRIDSIPRNVIIDAVRQNNLPKLLDRDQLLASRRKNPGFRLRSFNEAPITFAPTYKYDVGTDEYDSSEKKRSPAWCDRVLYRGLGRIKQLDYRRHEVRASDHRPVSAFFKLRIKTVLPSERAATWESCQAEFQKERKRLTSEASIEYLISVLGTEPKQARALILGSA
ncbi:hypothetical protein SI65_04299 [Aspergillus cristatus]|uniref:Inositol polyphosphate-related phosphatase domain-containing protein n=1 Tax=Aspergillus cristatus TaxID=573508 RepID=A0A1E3BLH2_ASPCR|nr:hypothetical protein SI65_04299 [Aspergillus cristatus]